MFASAVIAALLAASTPSATAVADTNAVPPRIVATWNQAQRELRRTVAQQADGVLDEAAAKRRREAIGRAFERVCRTKGIPEETIRYWRGKLNSGMAK